MKYNKTLIFETMLVFVILLFLLLYTSPRQIYPLHGMVISNEDFLFEIENSREIELSPNADFINYISLKEGEEITLPPGTYFWKVKGVILDSKIKNFTIKSEASLVLKENEGIYRVQNSGNVDLNLTRKQGDKITFATILNIGEVEEFEEDNSTYEGGQI